MKLTNTDLMFFVDKIKLKAEDMPKYRDQVKRLTEGLEAKIRHVKRNVMTTRVVRAI